ncbi:S49 family peptidase [Saccharopolyspora griseoalba]|uniref:S49 family peptidase n=1 Tax=Saccharopolyspora griseoalba TaxID=1431848 RepID=A0ABW2LMT8_9PSEU
MNDNAPQKLADLVSSVTGKLPGKLAEKAERGPVVAVVKLHGPITPQPSPMSRPTISLQTTESALTRAFGQDRLSAVVLSINSPGGAPTQSALVADRIRGLADEKGVPVLAFCEDVAASGGYWLACAADEIYAHKTSLVGSVGVVSASFGMTGLMEKLGVERRVYAAGENKVRLDPFRPEKEEDVQWLRGLQDELHGQFTDWVRQRRGGRLTGTAEELFSGEVWTGAKADELGLVDGVGTLREIVESKYPDAHVQTVEARKPLLARLGMGAQTALGRGPAENVLSALDALEHRALWNRFGL